MRGRWDAAFDRPSSCLAAVIGPNASLDFSPGASPSLVPIPDVNPSFAASPDADADDNDQRPTTNDQRPDSIPNPAALLLD